MWISLKKFAAIALVSVIFIGNPAESEAKSNSIHPRVNLVSDGFSYTLAFQTALWWKFAKEMTGDDYVTFVGPERYFIAAQPRLCSSREVEEMWRHDPARCSIASGARDLACWNKDGCVVFSVSPSLIQDQRFKLWIISAIEYPCATLRDPRTYETKVAGNIQGGAPLTANGVWAVLACGGQHPTTGRDLRIDDQTGVVEFRFDN